MIPSLPRLTTLLLACAFLPLSGCGGASGRPTPAPFVADLPAGPTDRDPATDPLPSVPPPEPPLTPVFDADAFVHGRHVPYGAFPSDVVIHGNTLFTTDGDQPDAEGAWIVPLDVDGPVPVPSGRFAPVLVPNRRLRDSAGNPPDLASPIGFGPFLNDLEVVTDTLGFVLVNAGGSDSTPTLSNLVAFDPTTGAIRQVVDLATSHASSTTLLDSTGALVPGGAFVQSGAEALAYAPLTETTGRLYVAMTNLIIGTPSYGTVKYPATVQVFDVTPADPAPVRIPGSGAVLTPGGYNAVSLAAIEADGLLGLRGAPRLLVTVAGTTTWNSYGLLVPATDASVVAYAADTGTHLGTFRLGRAGLAATRPALGRDASGHRVGFFPSAVTGEIYLLRLDGLYTRAVDVTRLAVLRGPDNGIPIEAGAAGAPGGNVTGVALSPDGRTLAVAGFGDLFAVPTPEPGRIYLLGLPADLLTGSGFGASFVPGTSLYATVPGRAFGALALDPNPGSGPDLYVAVSSAFDLDTYLAAGNGSLGTLTTFGFFAE